MNTAHSYPTVVSKSDADYIIVIGGQYYEDWIATVELFQVKTRCWHKLTDMPQPLTFPSATCSLQVLQSSDEPITSQGN